MQIYKYVIKISKFANMKNNAFFLFLFSIFIFSCNTDFDINAEWEEVTVVFGLLDQNQDKQYIRINKAFLGDESAIVMASVADSINYNPENLEVKIQKVTYDNLGNYNLISEKILRDTIMYKEDGIFSADENIIYVFDTDNFLAEGKNYLLVVTNLITGKVITGQTELIHELSLMSSFNNPAYKMGFFSQTGEFSTTTIEWDHAKNAAIYQLTMFLNYTEYGVQDTVEKTISKIFPVVQYNGNSQMSQKITGEEFFSFIRNSIDPEDSNVQYRRVNDIDLLFSVGTIDLQTYINLNEPPTGIVQERPLFTNITNGIGLFSARYNKIQGNILLTNTTKQAIANQTDLINNPNPPSWNFIFP